MSLKDVGEKKILKLLSVGTEKYFEVLLHYYPLILFLTKLRLKR